MTTTTGLSEQEIEILRFERQWYRHQALHDQQARDLFGISATTYYQKLNALLDRPEALRQFPVVVKRLRRLRDARRARR